MAKLKFEFQCLASGRLLTKDYFFPHHFTDSLHNNNLFCTVKHQSDQLSITDVHNLQNRP